MAKLSSMSFKITTALSSIPVKDLFNSEEIVLIPQDFENDGSIFVAGNPNSTDVRTSTLSPTITGIVGNQYDVTDSGLVTVDNVEYIFYTPSDATGIVAGESVTINQGIANYTTTVFGLDSGDVLLHKIDGEPGFTPANTDLLIFNHSIWYYICSSSLTKVAVGDKFIITLDDDSTTQVKTVVFKDSTHIGFTISTTNYTASDVALFHADTKLEAFGTKLQSTDYTTNGLLVKHGTTDSTVFNMTIYPKSEYNWWKSFFF